MDIEDLKNQVNQFIGEDNLNQAFTILKENISPDSEVYSEFLMLLNRNTRLMKQRRKGTLSYVDLELLNNNLINDISSFLKELENSDLTSIPKKNLTKKIDNKILVFAPDENYKLDFEVYLKRLSFTNTHFKLYKNNAASPDSVLIVFEYIDLPYLKGLGEKQRKIVNACAGCMEKCLNDNSNKSQVFFFYLI